MLQPEPGGACVPYHAQLGVMRLGRPATALFSDYRHGDAVMQAPVVSCVLWLLMLLLLQVFGLCGICQSRLCKANGRNTSVLLLPGS